MPIVFGMASSHAPALFTETPAAWDRLWHRYADQTPQPPRAAEERAAVIEDFIRRRKANFAALKTALSAAKPDVLIVIGGDQNEWFSGANVPNLMVYAGDDDLVGFHNFGAEDQVPALVPWENPERFGVRMHIDRPLANLLLDGLVEQGFDVAISRRAPKVDSPRKQIPHALARPLPQVMENPELPIVPLIVKTVERSPAVLNGERCLELGRALERIFRDVPARVALYGSGGMSHDPLGPLAGWVDEALDRWFLEELAAGRPDKLKSLFSFHALATDSGSGELRTWLPVASALDVIRPGIKADVIDYFPASKAVTGCGWVVWPEVGTPAATAAA